MKSSFKNCAQLIMLSLFMMAVASVASAQLNSTPPQTIALTATLPESLTVSLSGNAVSFNLTAGSATNAGGTTITATTSWALNSGRNTLRVNAYFASAANALTGGGNSIPSSAFKIADNGGASAALVNTVPNGGPLAGLQLASVAITNANRVSSRTDQMAFNIDLSAPPLAQLPAAVYTGTLNIQAQATP